MLSDGSERFPVPLGCFLSVNLKRGERILFIFSSSVHVVLPPDFSVNYSDGH